MTEAIEILRAMRARYLKAGKLIEARTIERALINLRGKP